MAKSDIFISYRRLGGFETAKHLYDLLKRDGYRVSFDIDTIRNGNFDQSLLECIDDSKDFILIVDQHVFDKTLDPQINPKEDYLRQELAYALKKEKNIIPVILNKDYKFPSNLPPDVSSVITKNGPQYSNYYFDDFYERLIERFLLSKKHSSISRKIQYFFSILVVIFILCYSFIQIIMPLVSPDIPDEYISFIESLSNPPYELSNNQILTKEQFLDSILTLDSFEKFDYKSREFVERYFEYCIYENINSEQGIDYFFTNFRHTYMQDFIIRYVYMYFNCKSNSEKLNETQLLSVYKNTQDVLNKLPGGYDPKFPLMSESDDFNSFLTILINDVPCEDKDEMIISLIKNSLSDFNKHLKHRIEIWTLTHKINAKIETIKNPRFNSDSKSNIE